MLKILALIILLLFASPAYPWMPSPGGGSGSLAADPAGCSGGQVTTDINAAGVSTCTSWSANVLTLLGAADYAAFLNSIGLTGATTTILVGGGAGVAPVFTTATGTGAPARAGSPTFTGIATSPTYSASGAVSTAALSSTGLQFKSAAANLTDTGATGTRAVGVANSYGIPTFIGDNAVTVTDAATLYIAGIPVAGTNITLTNAWAAYILGNTRLVGTLYVDGVEITRTDNPTCVTYYEATSDGNSYKTICAPAKGTGFTANRAHTLGNYDSSDILSTTVNASGYVQNTQPVEVNGSAHIHLTAAQVSGTTIYNTGQAAADVVLQLPTAAAGYQFLATVGTAQAGNHWGVQADTNDKIYLIAADGTISAGTDAAAVVMTAAQVGQSFACWTMKTDAYDWQCKAIAIGTSTFAAHAGGF